MTDFWRNLIPLPDGIIANQGDFDCIIYYIDNRESPRIILYSFKEFELV